MIIDIPDEAIAKLAINANCSTQCFYFHTDKPVPPLRVDIRSTGDGMRFTASGSGYKFQEVTLTLQEIFENVPRVSRLLAELESWVPS